MAGGFRLFSPGTTWDEADLQEFIMDQVVTYHATYAALTSAISSPTEGMLAWGGDVLYGHDGTNWFRLRDIWSTTPSESIANASKTGNQTINSGTAADITDLTFSAKHVKNRPMAVCGVIDAEAASASTSVLVVELDVGGTTEAAQLLHGNTERCTNKRWWVITPASDSAAITYKLTAYRTGSTNFTIYPTSSLSMHPIGRSYPAQP